jgi:hypothetical protein
LAYFRGISQNPYHGVDKAILEKNIQEKHMTQVLYTYGC